MPDFSSLAEFAGFLTRLTVGYDQIQQEQMERACRVVQTEIRAAIGSHRFTPLAASTVAKKGHDDQLRETGELRGEIAYTVTRAGLGVAGEIGSNLERAVYLELGTSKMPPRPFLSDSAHRREAEVVSILGQGAIRGLTGRGN